MSGDINDNPVTKNKQENYNFEQCFVSSQTAMTSFASVANSQTNNICAVAFKGQCVVKVVFQLQNSVIRFCWLLTSLFFIIRFFIDFIDLLTLWIYNNKSCQLLVSLIIGWETEYFIVIKLIIACWPKGCRLFPQIHMNTLQ